MREDGTYARKKPAANEEIVDVHKVFYKKAFEEVGQEVELV
jgi:polyphosphate kinase